jgi:hypothetical protein
LNAVAVNLAAGASDFIVGDSIQQPMAYNYHPTGVTSIVGKILGGTSLGSGVVSNNVYTQEIQNAYRGIGNWNNGISFDSGTISGAGVKFSGPVAGALVRQNDNSASNQQLFFLFNGSNAIRTVNYDRTDDVLQIGSSLQASWSDSRIGQGTLPQSNTSYYMFYNASTWSGLIIAPGAVPNAGVPIFDTQVQGFSRLRVENTKVLFSNAIDVVGDYRETTPLKFGVSQAQREQVGSMVVWYRPPSMQRRVSSRGRRTRFKQLK